MKRKLELHCLYTDDMQSEEQCAHKLCIQRRQLLHDVNNNLISEIQFSHDNSVIAQKLDIELGR